MPFFFFTSVSFIAAVGFLEGSIFEDTSLMGKLFESHPVRHICMARLPMVWCMCWKYDSSYGSSYSVHIVAHCGTTGRRWITLLFYVSLSKTCPMWSVEHLVSPCQFVWNGRGVFFCQPVSCVLWASPVWFSMLVHSPGRLSHRTSSTCQTITPKIHSLQDLSTCKLCWGSLFKLEHSDLRPWA